jgi:WD40 repeat protein
MFKIQGGEVNSSHSELLNYTDVHLREIAQTLVQTFYLISENQSYDNSDVYRITLIDKFNLELKQFLNNGNDNAMSIYLDEVKRYKEKKAKTKSLEKEARSQAKENVEKLRETFENVFKTIALHDHRIIDVKISSDFKTLLTVSVDAQSATQGKIIVTDLVNDKTLYEFEGKKTDISHDFRYLIISGPIRNLSADPTNFVNVPVYDLKTGNVLYTLEIQHGYESPIVTANNQFIVFSSFLSNGFKVFELSTGKLKYESEKGDRLIAAPKTKNILIFIQNIDNDSIKILDLNTNEISVIPIAKKNNDSVPIQVPNTKPMIYQKGTLSPDEHYLVLYLRSMSNKEELRIIDLPLKKLIVTIDSNNSQLDISSQLNQIITQPKSKEIKVFELSTGKALYEIITNEIIDSQVHNNDYIIIALDGKNSIFVYDRLTGKESFTIEFSTEELEYQVGTISSMAISPNKRYLAASDMKGYLYIFDLQEREFSMSLKVHKDYISNVFFTPDSNYIITSSKDGTVKKVDYGAFDFFSLSAANTKKH